MDDLFRFFQLRPAEVAAPTEIKKLAANFVPPGAAHELARRKARDYVGEKEFVLKIEELKFAVVAEAVRKFLSDGPQTAKEISNLVLKRTSQSVAKVAADRRFLEEQQRLSNSLVAMWLLSDSNGGDAPAMVHLARGYDAIALAATGRDPLSLRTLCIDEDGRTEIQLTTRAVAEQPGSVPPVTEPKRPERLDNIEHAITVLKALPVTAFESPQACRSGRESTNIERRIAALETPTEASATALGGASGETTSAPIPWLLSPKSIASLSNQVQQTLSSSGFLPTDTPLPIILNKLDELRIEEMVQVEASKEVTPTVTSLGHVRTNAYVGRPTSRDMPAGSGNIRPVGVGDLLLVKEHVLRYEGGDLAHVENILKSERISRETRRLERTETTVLRESETTKEETRDTQTTERFSLKRETADTIKTDESFAAGVTVNAKYGSFVEVTANAEYATATATESATKQATEFSKDVVARSASKLVERILERRSVTTIVEFEEKYEHEFDNTGGTGHISGYYQWVNKVTQAQVYNYGKRLLFDVTLPEPGTNFILCQTKNAEDAQKLEAPPPFLLRADQLNEGNYRLQAQLYEATAIEPPPSPVKTIARAYEATVGQEPHESSKAETIPIEDGYVAKYAYVQSAYFWTTAADVHINADASIEFIVGAATIMGTTTAPTSNYLTLAGEVGSIGYGARAFKIRAYAVVVEIFCERTQRAYEAWQIKVHGAITQAYQAKRQAYEQALAQARTAAGTVIAGRNPLFNTQLILGELRKQCLTLLTGQQFTAFGALELSPEGYAQPSLSSTEKQMPYVRFFEQAFEWEHMVYFFYPYFWGLKKAWPKHMLLDDADPKFASFLRAGAARAVFPVRPGFEAAIVHYLETGEIWNGGPPPSISSPLYVSIIKEIQEATGAPGDETPVGDPWRIELPTTLVRLRANNDLPEWKKVNDEWQPAN